MPPPSATLAVESSHMAAATRRRSWVGSSTLVLVGILLVAVNLRAAITSLGALLEEVRGGLHVSGALAGVITTLPAVAFAAFGGLTPWLTRRFPAARLLAGTMVLLAVGQALRVATDSSAIFIATSVLALGGIAVANVLLPGLVKQHFPDRVGLVTGVYTMSMIAGASLAAATAVPIAHAAGTWRAGLGVWALLAVVATLPWVPGALRRTTAARAITTAAEPGDGGRARITPARTRLGWALALYFGTQSLSGYALMGWLAQLFRDAGYSPATAGLLLAAVTAIGIPVALLMPTIASRRANMRPLVLALSAAMAVGYLGLAVAPHTGAVFWVVASALGQGAFPLALTMIGMRARTSRGTVALSAFAQSTGYVIGALGPLVVGLLYEASAGWWLPIGFLLAALAVQTAAGLAAARPRFVEDAVGRQSAETGCDASSPATASATVG
jgi:CP family cyanate transporter-like MFS transporter